jgi:hypothetical protein
MLLLYYWAKQQYYRSALACALAVAAKLIPLMLLPVLCWRLWLKRGVVYGFIVAGVNGVIFALFYDWDMVLKIRESMQLYFQRFEFNASVYYLFRYQLIEDYWRLWDYHDYFMKVEWVENALRLDWYVILRRILPILSVIGILGTACRHYSIATVANGCLWAFALYFCFGTTIHPWYISSLVLLSVVTNYRFPLFWSAMIGGTYIAYQGGTFEEQTWMIVLEYSVVLAVLVVEWWKQNTTQDKDILAIAQKSATKSIENRTL